MNPVAARGEKVRIEGLAKSLDCGQSPAPSPQPSPRLRGEGLNVRLRRACRQRAVEAAAQRLVVMRRMARIGRRGGHAAQQIEIVLVAIGLEIEIVGQIGQPLVAHRLDECCMKRS